MPTVVKDNSYPLLFEPIYRDYVWGGGRIPRIFHRPARAGTSAESWEISDRPQDQSIVRNGPLAGHTLGSLVSRFGAALLGSASRTDRFPLLIKIIDARQCLSVQVHPDDRSAAAYGGEAKTEMWYVLAAEEDAHVYAGLKRGTDASVFLHSLQDHRAGAVLHSIPIRRGGAIYVPGGRVHAIDRGCLILEVQQNSDTTYRIHDWNRSDANGSARPLHIEDALKVIDWADLEPSSTPPRLLSSGNSVAVWQVIASPYFNVKRIALGAPMSFDNDGRSFHALFTACGQVEVSAGNAAVKLPGGTSCLLPAAIPRYTLTPLGGPAEVIHTAVV